MMASSMMMIDESSRNNLINQNDDDRRRRRNNYNNQFYDQQDQNYHNLNDDTFNNASNSNNTRRQQNNFNRRRNNNNNNNNQRFNNNNNQQYQPQQQYQNWQPPPPPLTPLNEPQQQQPYLQSQQQQFYDNSNEFMQYNNESRNQQYHHQQQRRNNNNNNSQRNQRQQQQQPPNLVPPDWDYSMNETTNNETNSSRPSNNNSRQNQQQNRNRGNRGGQNNNNNNNNNRGGKNNKQNRPSNEEEEQQQNQRPEIETPSETTVTRNHQQKSSSGGGPRGGGGKKFTKQNSVSSSVSGVSSISMSSRDQTRRDILTDQLRKNKYECMVCYQYIRNDRAIWSCRVCFHIFHLACVKKWAQSSMAPPVGAQDVTPATEWRCPGCQSAYNQVPNKSTCFCTKKLNPEHQFRGDNNNQQQNAQRKQHQLAHSCGEVCARLLSLSAPFYSDESGSSILSECKHKCTLLCHPGPCPPCETMVTRACKCGKVKFQVKCSSTRVPICDRACEKMLACGKHVCGQICHAGECGACQVDVEQTCGCHGTKRTVKCGSKEDTDYPQGVYECEEVCGKQLACKNHTCQEKCHLGPCKPCGLMPSNLINCPCGKTPVRELLLRNKIIRTSCRDPVPTCEKQCERLLECAHNTNDQTKSDFHVCTQPCHTGECGPCERDVQVRCRCGKETETVKCSVSVEARATKRCLRRCQKKKSCGRHQCGEMCCDDKDHICMQVCNKPLACGIHRCEELCHRGTCKRCLVASFEERVCQCGATIQYPPIRCGTKPLECPNKCTRVHACDHPVTHNCHWEPECPPCSYLTSKMCMGGHEMRHHIPCHMKDVSCGNRCNKPLAGCSHRCQRTCHKGECTVEGSDEKCTQPCQKPRPYCDHVCGAPCHETSAAMCPDTVCQEIVMVKCKCGLKSKQIKCGTKMYGAASQVMFENLASQIKEMLTCKSIDVATFKSQESLKRKFELECDDECFLEERNRNIGQALLTEASLKPKPIYSDFLKSFAREDMQFAQSMEKRFETLVAESKAPTNKTGKKSVQLPVMKQAERRFVHELAPYYGIETQSFDSEPQRNVCLYASREKSCLPAATLTQSMDVRRGLSTMPKLRQLNAKLETGVQSQLKVLNPSEADLLTVSSAFAVLGDDLDSSQTPQQRLQHPQPIQQQQTSSSKDTGKSIDYFDFD